MAISQRTIGICAYCGDEFTRKRSTGKFCKPAHRTAYNYLPYRIAGMWERALHDIVQITMITEDYPHLYDYADDAYKMITAQVKHQHKKLKKK